LNRDPSEEERFAIVPLFITGKIKRKKSRSFNLVLTNKEKKKEKEESSPSQLCNQQKSGPYFFYAL